MLCHYPCHLLNQWHFFPATHVPARCFCVVTQTWGRSRECRSMKWRGPALSRAWDSTKTDAKCPRKASSKRRAHRGMLFSDKMERTTDTQRKSISKTACWEGATRKKRCSGWLHLCGVQEKAKPTYRDRNQNNGCLEWLRNWKQEESTPSRSLAARRTESGWKPEGEAEFPASCSHRRWSLGWACLPATPMSQEKGECWQCRTEGVGRTWRPGSEGARKDGPSGQEEGWSWLGAQTVFPVVTFPAASERNCAGKAVPTTSKNWGNILRNNLPVKQCIYVFLKPK